MSAALYLACPRATDGEPLCGGQVEVTTEEGWLYVAGACCHGHALTMRERLRVSCDAERRHDNDTARASAGGVW
jgi:hypothetical protein